MASQNEKELRDVEMIASAAAAVKRKQKQNFLVDVLVGNFSVASKKKKNKMVLTWLGFFSVVGHKIVLTNLWMDLLVLWVFSVGKQMKGLNCFVNFGG